MGRGQASRALFVIERLGGKIEWIHLALVVSAALPNQVSINSSALPGASASS